VGAPRLKLELPFATAADIEAAVAQFEAGALPYAHWTHRAHLAVALVYAHRHAYDAALIRIRDHINAYNRICGQPDGYNETVTVLFLRKVFAEASGARALPALPEELARLATLCTAEWVYRHYSKERVWSAEAKARWLAPDLNPLDF
jgi:hypothetical protein